MSTLRLIYLWRTKCVQKKRCKKGKSASKQQARRRAEQVVLFRVVGVVAGRAFARADRRVADEIRRRVLALVVALETHGGRSYNFV